MSSECEIRRFFEAYIQSRGGKIAGGTDDTVTVAYPDGTQQFTYQPAVAREKKIPLITTGSPAFQQILKESLENGVLCQISLSPKESFEALLEGYFRYSSEACMYCQKAQLTREGVRVCTRSEPCFHQINNGKIVSAKVTKKEPARFFQFYYAVSFQNKLRAKSEETISILLDEEGNCLGDRDFEVGDVLGNEELRVQDFKSKLKPQAYDTLKASADMQLGALIKEKVRLFDLPLVEEKRARLRNFERRLRRERRERVISKKHDFDFQKWQTDFEALLEREEETYQTNVNVKLLNLLVINTAKVKFEVSLDNGAVIQCATTIGIGAPEVTCQTCKKNIAEGFATEDGFYVCGDCTRQSVDTGKLYSKKAPLTLDESLGEYFERDKGFVCSVCGKRHSRLLEFRCNHDNTSVCIHHYDLCDVCGKVFSKLNLTYTNEFQKKLCPKHAKKEP
ncbi:MAG: hypothetical protein ACQCN6_01345 [Candidatus Bathyarchaeia archaeon]